MRVVAYVVWWLGVGGCFVVEGLLDGCRVRGFVADSCVCVLWEDVVVCKHVCKCIMLIIGTVFFSLAECKFG